MTPSSSRPDFGDWLSPMLVKELRQGIRSKVFMSAFFSTQVLMILSVIFTLTAKGGNDSDSAASFLNGLFWFMIGVPLVLMMPLRGFGSLFGEIKSGTLELVFLTRLSALRIAAGKWSALMVQTLLLVSAVLPYVLLRYFLGGVDVIEDLQLLFFLLLASSMLTAATIALSPYESKLLRSLFSVGMALGFLFLLMSMMSFIASRIYAGSLGIGPVVWRFYVAAALFVPVFIFLCLEIAASRIAPPAENHALRKRLVGLYFLVMAAVLAGLGAPPSAAFGFVMFLLVVVVVDALAETQYFVRSIYRSFLGFGGPGRLLSLFFVPGWASASWFVALLVVVGGGFLLYFGQLADAKDVLFHVTYLGMLIFPAAVLRLFAPGTRYFLGLYIALQFFFIMLTLLVSMMSNFSDEDLKMFLAPLPTCAFILNLTNQVRPHHLTEFLTMASLATAGSLAILLARTISPRREIRKALDQIS